MIVSVEFKLKIQTGRISLSKLKQLAQRKNCRYFCKKESQIMCQDNRLANGTGTLFLEEISTHSWIFLLFKKRSGIGNEESSVFFGSGSDFEGSFGSGSCMNFYFLTVTQSPPRESCTENSYFTPEVFWNINYGLRNFLAFLGNFLKFS
jgi:hypothetical protein